MLAPHKATKVALPYGRLTPLGILLRCQDEKNGKKFADKTLIQSSLGRPDQKLRFYIPYKSGFISTLMQAYNKHQNIVIRPDDIWLAILTQFNMYVNQNVEELRSKFVAHDGERLVEIRTGGNRASNNWGTLIQDLTEQLDEYLVDKYVKPWILPNFTTTVETDVAVASAVMLSTFKGYFKYRVVFSCGIPSVTLIGTRVDWVSVLRRVQQLHHFDIESYGQRRQAIGPHRRRGSMDQSGLMNEWQSRLEAVLKRLIAIFDGEEDEEFWSRIVTATRYGSGSQRALTGWATAFATFNPSFLCDSFYKLDGVQFGCLDAENLPVDLVEVPIEINDNGYKTMGLLTAGVLGARKLGVTTIGLERAWWIFEDKESG
jgi:hypothetical protein